ncbi:MAG: aminopeptidase P N-terminal domain-containing protein, partial [Spirochaetia bacterium]|nr:aminopeptidase P N-terminal domain-containing protein [Spirochaetia bacterium]
MMPGSYNKSLFQKRRALVQQKLPPDSIVLIFGGQAPLKSNDVHYTFRPDSDFYYLTGFHEEEGVLVLTNDQSLLYMLPRDPEKEIWNGIRLGIENGVDALGVDRAEDTAKFNSDLGGLLKNKRHLYHFFGRSAERDTLIFQAAGAALRRARMGEFGPTSILHPSTVLHEMRMIKSPEEVRWLEQCADITTKAHIDLMRMTRPGMFEYELHAALLYEFRRNDATEAYPSIVASGHNACILHYTENNRQTVAGDLIL